MSSFSKLFLAAATAAILSQLPAPARAQAPAGDRDDQFVVTGCVTAATDVRMSGPQSMFVWSRGDVYLASPRVGLRPSETAVAVGTTGRLMPIFYWIDDENDFAKHVGQRVEIVGELSGRLAEGEVEIEHVGGFTDIEFEVGGREATARIPRAWLGPATSERDSIEVDVAVRMVDVEAVTVLGPCVQP